MPSPGVDNAKLGSLQRTDGSIQVTYNGWPLYRYIKDTVPGDTTGQGILDFGDTWYLVSPTGDAIGVR